MKLIIYIILRILLDNIYAISIISRYDIKLNNIYIKIIKRNFKYFYKTID